MFFSIHPSRDLEQRNIGEGETAPEIKGARFLLCTNKWRTRLSRDPFKWSRSFKPAAELFPSSKGVAAFLAQLARVQVS